MDDDDIIEWADGTWCYGFELNQFGWKSDDYKRIPFGSAEYLKHEGGAA